MLSHKQIFWSALTPSALWQSGDRVAALQIVLRSCVWLTVLAIVLLCRSTAQAIPIVEYHRNLEHAITALDTLQQSDEEETPSAYESRFHDTISSIRLLLPKTQMVESSSGLLSVDNGWLHDELDSLEKARVNKRREQLVHLLERIRALEQRVVDAQRPASKTTDKKIEKERLNNILSRPEYERNPKATSAFARLLSDLIRWLTKLLPQQSPLAPGQAFSVVWFAEVLVIGLCALLLAYLLFSLFRSLARTRKLKRKEKPEARVVLGEHIAADQSAKDLLADAELLARDGQLRAAIRKAYIALLVELGDRNIISLAQHKTNRDYLTSLRTAPALYANMNGLTKTFEQYWYGVAQPTDVDWQTFRAGYQEVLKQEH